MRKGAAPYGNGRGTAETNSLFRGAATLFALLAVLSAARAWAEPPATDAPSSDEKKSFHASFIGEGGGFQEGNPASKDYLENAGREDAAGKPQAQPEAQRGNSALPRAVEPKLEPAPEPKKARDAFVIKDPASRRYEQTHPARPAPPAPPADAPATAAAPAQGKNEPAAPAAFAGPAARAAREKETPDDRKRYSLWEGLSSPLSLPANKVKDADADQASQLGRQDYDGHILGAAPAAVAKAGTPDGNGLASAASGKEPAAPQGETFVAVSLDLKAAELKDAVAGLSAAGFRPDARFQPVFSGVGEKKADVWGWMPSGRVPEALRLPAVARVQTSADTAAAAAAPAPRGPLSQVLVGIRVRAGLGVDETYARVARELSSEAGLRVTRTVGYQPVPGSHDLALVVVGEVPARGLSRLMGHPEVLKVMPAPPAPDAGRSPRKPAALLRFLSFVQGRAPVLVLVTLLLLLGPVADKVGAVLRVFVPYR